MTKPNMTQLSLLNDFNNEVEEISMDIFHIHWLFKEYISTWSRESDSSLNREQVAQEFINSIEKWSIKNLDNRLKVEEEIEENLHSFAADGNEYAYLCKFDKLVGRWQKLIIDLDLIEKLAEIAEHFNIQLSYTHIAQNHTSLMANFNKNNFLQYQSVLRMYATQNDQIPSECLDRKNISDLAKLTLFYCYRKLFSISYTIDQIKGALTNSLIANNNSDHFPNLFEAPDQQTIVVDDELQWRGNKTDLAELVWALSQSGQIVDISTGQPVTQKKLAERIATFLNIDSLDVANLMKGRYGTHSTATTFKAQGGRTFINTLQTLLERRVLD